MCSSLVFCDGRRKKRFPSGRIIQQIVQFVFAGFANVKDGLFDVNGPLPAEVVPVHTGGPIFHFFALDQLHETAQIFSTIKTIPFCLLTHLHSSNY